MKLFKSLLLASATGLVAVSGASAADLGAKKPSPVEYVRACYNPLWGTSGGFVIPGTQTCVRVGGQARFDYAYQQPFVRSNAPSGFRGAAVVTLDAITPSEYGNVRAFASVGMSYRTGSANQTTATGTRQGTFVSGPFSNSGLAGPLGAAQGGAVGGAFASGGTEFLFAGFVQFAGITAGRTASFFDPFFTPEIIGTTFRSSPGNVNLIAYTAALGNGLTATISAEDPTVRRQGVALSTPVSGGGAFVGFYGNGVPLAAPFGALGALAPAQGLSVTQKGIRMPDVVAALQLDQAWGSAKLSGVIREVTVLGPNVGTRATPVVGGAPDAVVRVLDPRPSRLAAMPRWVGLLWAP